MCATVNCTYCIASQGRQNWRKGRYFSGWGGNGRPYWIVSRLPWGQRSGAEHLDLHELKQMWMTDTCWLLPPQRLRQPPPWNTDMHPRDLWASPPLCVGYTGYRGPALRASRNYSRVGRRVVHFLVWFLLGLGVSLDLKTKWINHWLSLFAC